MITMIYNENFIYYFSRVLSFVDYFYLEKKKLLKNNKCTKSFILFAKEHTFLDIFPKKYKTFYSTSLAYPPKYI